MAERISPPLVFNPSSGWTVTGTRASQRSRSFFTEGFPHPIPITGSSNLSIGLFIPPYRLVSIRSEREEISFWLTGGSDVILDIKGGFVVSSPRRVIGCPTGTAEEPAVGSVPLQGDQVVVWKDVDGEWVMEMRASLGTQALASAWSPSDNGFLGLIALSNGNLVPASLTDSDVDGDLDTLTFGNPIIGLSYALPLWTLTIPAFDINQNIVAYTYAVVLQTFSSVLLYALYTTSSITLPTGMIWETPGRVVGGGPYHLVLQGGRVIRITSDDSLNFSFEEMNAPPTTRYVLGDNLFITNEMEMVQTGENSLYLIYNAGTQIFPMEVIWRANGPVSYSLLVWDGSAWVEEVPSTGTNKVKIALYPYGATEIYDVRLIYREVQ